MKVLIFLRLLGGGRRGFLGLLDVDLLAIGGRGGGAAVWASTGAAASAAPNNNDMNITRRIEFLPCGSRRDGAAKRRRVLGARCLRMRRDYTVAATAGSQVAAKCCCSFGI
jgi:hypothetical protein